MSEIEKLIERHEKDLDPLEIEGYRNLVSELDDFFEAESNMSIDDNHQIETFASVALESSDIVRAMRKFYGKPMFSNVTISAKDEEGNDVTWYGLVSSQARHFSTHIYDFQHNIITYQVLLILKFYTASGREPLHFALVRWYDQIDEITEISGCPRVKLIDQYSCIPLESVDQTVHIVSRFGKENKYLVNTFIF